MLVVADTLLNYDLNETFLAPDTVLGSSESITAEIEEEQCAAVLRA